MKKKGWIIIAIIVIALLIGAGIFFYSRNANPTKNENNYEANKTSANNNTTATANKTPENTNSTPEENTETPAQNEITQGIAEAQNTSVPVIEEQIATFTTKIYSTDSARQNNISITCNTLNGTIVKNGETFSFCGTVGQASTSKGYQEADIFVKLVVRYIMLF